VCKKMRLIIQFKDPDGVYDGVHDAVKESLPEGLSQQEQDALMDLGEEELIDELQQWIKNSEYIRVEFDTGTGTAVILRT